MIQAVFIDIDDTLIDFYESSRQAIILSCRDNHIEYTDSLFHTFLRINDSFWKSYEKKQISKDCIFSNRWKEVFIETGIDFDGISFEKSFYNHLTETAVPVNGALQLLQYLSNKYDVYAASNGSLMQQIKRLKNAGMFTYFKDIFVSEQVGFSKPSREFFSGIFNSVGNLEPENSIMIGDSVSADISGAIRFGMKTIWYNPLNIDNATLHIPDYTVASLDEIQLIL